MSESWKTKTLIYIFCIRRGKINVQKNILRDQTTPSGVFFERQSKISTRATAISHSLPLANNLKSKSAFSPRVAHLISEINYSPRPTSFSRRRAIEYIKRALLMKNASRSKLNSFLAPPVGWNFRCVDFSHSSAHLAGIRLAAALCATGEEKGKRTAAN